MLESHSLLEQAVLVQWSDLVRGSFVWIVQWLACGLLYINGLWQQTFNSTWPTELCKGKNVKDYILSHIPVHQLRSSSQALFRLPSGLEAWKYATRHFQSWRPYCGMPSACFLLGARPDVFLAPAKDVFAHLGLMFNGYSIGFIYLWPCSLYRVG